MILIQEEPEVLSLVPYLLKQVNMGLIVYYFVEYVNLGYNYDLYMMCHGLGGQNIELLIQGGARAVHNLVVLKSRYLGSSRMSRRFD